MTARLRAKPKVIVMLRLSKYYKKVLSIISGLCIGVIILLFFAPLSEWGTAAIAISIFILTSIIFGFEKRHFREKFSLIAIVIAAAGIWLILEYLFGIWLGFARSQLGWSFFLNTTIPFVLIFFATELMRANLIQKADRSKLAILAVWLLATLLGICYIKTQYHLTNNMDITEFVFISVLPWLAQSIFLTLLVQRGGWLPAVIFRSLTELPIMALLIYPAFDAYLLGVMNLLLPVIMFYIIRHATKERDEPEKHQHPSQVWRTIYYACFVSLIGSIIAISSGLFKYYPLVIASSSMVPNINVGDFVIVKKLTSKELTNLTEGDILIFKKTNRIIVHRIMTIDAISNSLVFTTKGDANKENDSWTVAASEVIGTATLKLPQVGYPTLWVHNLLKDSN